jgi:hypothetical protein
MAKDDTYVQIGLFIGEELGLKRQTRPDTESEHLKREEPVR